MIKHKLVVFPTLKLLAEEFATEILELVHKSFHSKTPCYIMLSGGNTPQTLFEALAKFSRARYCWDFVHLYWSDERCVAPTDVESNYRMTRQYLLNFINIPPENIHRIKGELDPDVEAERYEIELRGTVPYQNLIPVFDLLILGMGPDGHTASIFPESLDLVRSERLCVATVNPYTGQKRITVTLKVFNHARKIVFMVSGHNKAGILAEILNKKGNYRRYPASYINPLGGELVWMADEAAGKD